MARGIRQYYLEFGLAMLAYLLLLAASLVLLRSAWLPDWLRPLAAVLPMIPAASICWAVLRQLRRMDELERRQQHEALAFAFAGTALATLSYGFLELVGLPKMPTMTVWPIMGLLWIVGLGLARRRYR